MAQTYTALIQQRKDWWIGWIEEIPGVNCQEKTREAQVNTRKAVSGALSRTLSKVLAAPVG